MATERELIERLVEKLSDVASDTHYGIHDDDYCIPFGETAIQPHQTTPCGCALCHGREFLATQSTR